MKFTINRGTWAHGTNADGKNNTAMGGLLFNAYINGGLGPPAELQCCLGHLASACGYTEDQLRGAGTPAGAAQACRVNKFPDGLVSDGRTFGFAPVLAKPDEFYNTDACRKLMTINDDQMAESDSRERMLTDAFKRLNIDVDFVGGEP